MARKADKLRGLWQSCRIEHVTVVGHGTMTLGGGSNNDMVYGYERGDCAVPIFDDASKKDGVCRSCREAGAEPGKVYMVDGVINGKWTLTPADEAEVARLLAIPKWKE